MLYVDIPTRQDFALLARERADACVSIYLKTTPLTPEIQASRIEMGNLIKEAQSQLEEAAFDKRRLAALLEALQDLQDDDDFWRRQAHSLAVFATPDSIRTYRLANDLSPMVQVADRFHLKPLFRAVTFSHAAFILALSENGVRLLELSADAPARPVEVPDLPADMASSVGPSTSNERGLSGRIHGREGHNVRLQQYVRKVDAALRPILAGRETPLVLAATGRIDDLFRQVCSYSELLSEGITVSPDHLSEAELTARTRPLLDTAHARALAETRALYEARAKQRRTTTDISDAARAATFGAIQTLLVDIDSVVAGFVDDESGEVRFVDKDDARAYGVVDEIAVRAFVNGATVLGVRREDIPDGQHLAAILRHPV